MLKVIPFATDYSVDEEGNVCDKGGNLLEVSYTRRGKPRVKLFISKVYKYAYRQVARVVLDTFRPIPTGTDFMSVIYVDGDVSNVNLNNLQWSHNSFIPMDIPGITMPDDAYVRIPGYSKYEISLSGEVRYVDNKKIKRSRENSKGYKNISIYTDEMEAFSTVGIHRLLALTFLRHPWDCEHLFVNHKNSDPRDNALNNLEWTTPGGNNRHAFEEGSRDSSSVIIKNVTTGEIKHFPSLTLLSEFLGKPKNILHVYLKHRLVRKFYPVNGWMLQFVSEEEPWPDKKASLLSATNEYVAAFNIRTRVVSISKNLKTLQALTAINDSSIRVLGTEDIPRPWKGYMISSSNHLSDLKSMRWPNYKESAITLFERMDRKCRPVRVTDTFTNNTTEWLGVKYWWRGVLPGSDPAVVCRHLKHSSAWRRWKFEFFDLYGERSGPDLVAARSEVV